MSTLNQETQTDSTFSDNETEDDLNDVGDDKDVLILDTVKRRETRKEIIPKKLDSIGVDEIKFYEDIVDYMNEDDDEETMDDEEENTRGNKVVERRKCKSFFSWKRLSGLDDLNNEEFKKELQRLGLNSS